jgi:hypothetical protein
LNAQQDELADRLSAVRLAFIMVTGQTDLTAAEYAAMLDVDPAVYDAYEAGCVLAPPQVLAAISACTGIDLEYLTTGRASWER